MDIDPAFKFDTRWPEYSPPKSAVSALVQCPSAYIDGFSLADAYMRDIRAAQKRTKI